MENNVGNELLGTFGLLVVRLHQATELRVLSFENRMWPRRCSRATKRSPQMSAGREGRARLLQNGTFLCNDCEDRTGDVPATVWETEGMTVEQASEHAEETGHDDWEVRIPVR